MDFDIIMQWLIRPYRKMKKDFLRTFSPYQHRGQVKKDLLQPFYGLWNLVIALLLCAAFIVATVVLSALAVIFSPLIGEVVLAGLFAALVEESEGKLFMGFIGSMMGLVLGAGLVVVGLPITVFVIGMPIGVRLVGDVTRSALQVLTAPLTLTLRLPLRGLLRAINGPSIWSPYKDMWKDFGKTFKPYQYAGKAGKDFIKEKAKAIHEKFERHVQHEQPTGIDVQAEGQLFVKLWQDPKQATLGEYAGLFKQARMTYLQEFSGQQVASAVPSA